MYVLYIIISPTWVWVIPKLAANGARSGNPRYWVLWKWRSNCWSCKDEYMDRGFRIFFPFPLTRVTSSPFSTTGSVRSPPMKSIYNECGRIIPHTHGLALGLTDLSNFTNISGARDSLGCGGGKAYGSTANGWRFWCCVIMKPRTIFRINLSVLVKVFLNLEATF